MFIIPTTSAPNHTFRCVIPVDGNNLALQFFMAYNTIAQYWTMTITDDLSGETLIANLPLIAGQYPSANLLEQYAYLRIGSACLVKTNPDNPDDMPNDTNLGTDFVLVWGDTLG